MEIINRDINGKIIEDLSKVQLPKELNQFVFNIYAKSGGKKT